MALEKSSFRGLEEGRVTWVLVCFGVGLCFLLVKLQCDVFFPGF